MRSHIGPRLRKSMKHAKAENHLIRIGNALAVDDGAAGTCKDSRKRDFDESWSRAALGSNSKRPSRHAMIASWSTDRRDSWSRRYTS